MVDMGGHWLFPESTKAVEGGSQFRIRPVGSSPFSHSPSFWLGIGQLWKLLWVSGAQNSLILLSR